MAIESDEREPLLVNSVEAVSSRELYKRKAARFSVLLILTLERIAFYSITGNLFLFLNREPLLWISYNAMTASYLFTGVVYIMSPICGWLADSKLGKYWMIFLGILVYIAGYVIFVLLAYDDKKVPEICRWKPSMIPISNSTDVDYHGRQPCDWLIFLVVCILGIAIGSIKANLAPFGADQVKECGSDGMRVFMNWYYWCINIGGFISLGAIAYIQQSMKNGFFIGYLISAVCLGLALMVFIISRPLYVNQRPVKSILLNIFRILREAYKSSRSHRIKVERQKRLSIDLPSPDVSTPSWLDLAKVRYGGSFHESTVEDVKGLGKIILVFAVLIPYWMVYFQMQTTFTAQGFHMRFDPWATNSTNNSSCINSTSPSCHQGFMIPAAWLSLFDVIFLIMVIPFMDRFVYPWLDQKGYYLSLLKRIGIGMFFALLAVVIAGFLEQYRLDLIKAPNSTIIVQTIGQTNYLAADLWIFWQVPQYSLIGISEVFASVAGLEFAYSQAPASMKGLIMGMFCLSMGIGSFLGIGLMSVVRRYWFSDEDHGNINNGHLDYYLFLLSGIQLFAILIFIFLTASSRSRRLDYRVSEFLSDSDHIPVGYAARQNGNMLIDEMPRWNTDQDENSSGPLRYR